MQLTGHAPSVHVASPPPQEPPFRVAFAGDAIEGTFRLTTPEQVDKLVQFLQLNKVMITPVLGAMDTEYTDDEEGREAEKRDRKHLSEGSGNE